MMNNGFSIWKLEVVRWVKLRFKLIWLVVNNVSMDEFCFLIV